MTKLTKKNATSGKISQMAVKFCDLIDVV